MIILNFVTCVYFIAILYDKWFETPVLLSFSEKVKYISNIPFPAVTICPQTKSKKEFFDITKAYYNQLDENITEDEFQRLISMANVCNTKEFRQPWNNSRKPFDMVQLIKDMAIPRNETIRDCLFGEGDEQCTNLFTPVLTIEGICFTFNILNSNAIYRKEVSEDLFTQNNFRFNTKWTVEKGYIGSNFEKYPIRAYGSGIDSGLKIRLALNESDFDYLCNYGIQGFKVLLHSPADLPRMGSRFTYVPLNSDAVINVDPKMMSASKGLSRYPLNTYARNP